MQRMQQELARVFEALTWYDARFPDKYFLCFWMILITSRWPNLSTWEWERENEWSGENAKQIARQSKKLHVLWLCAKMIAITKQNCIGGWRCGDGACNCFDWHSHLPAERFAWITAQLHRRAWRFSNNWFDAFVVIFSREIIFNQVNRMRSNQFFLVFRIVFFSQFLIFFFLSDSQHWFNCGGYLSIVQCSVFQWFSVLLQCFVVFMSLFLFYFFFSISHFHRACFFGVFCFFCWFHVWKSGFIVCIHWRTKIEWKQCEAKQWEGESRRRAQKNCEGIC